MCRVASNQVFRYTLSRWVADPIDFDTVKVIFDTSIRVCLRSTPITTPYNYSTYKRWHCFNLDAQYQFSLNQHLKAVWKQLLKVLSDSPVLYSKSFVSPPHFLAWLVSESFIKPIISNKVMLPFQRTFISSYPKAMQDTLLLPTHATSNLGIWLNGKIGLYLEDLANPKIRLNLVPNCL